ncbi:toll/interleukin-1 receptor domain-containing protein [bacterium]|nr:toll/interleukin-1 receptor domain-containing protein [bacterium]
MKYQVVKMGPEADGDRSRQLSAELHEDFAVLGLDPNEHLQELPADRVGEVDWKGTPVGAWFGGPDRTASPALATLLDNCTPVLPIVDDLTRYTQLVPDELLPVNGRQADDPRVRADVLRMLRLTRDRRQAFISYRRVDSSGVAGGLHDALTRRGYSVFLDTASVEAGAQFQDILWDRLADMDLLVLLDSPDALTSRWLLQELVQVNNLGLGVLQLVWPGRTPAAETHFSTHCSLRPTDFVNGDSGRTGLLTEDATRAIAALAEVVRIRSLGARRRRVTDELVTRLQDGRFRAAVQPVGPVTIADAGAAADDPPAAVAIPVVGLPDARGIQALEAELTRFWEVHEDRHPGHLAGLIQARNVRVVYDGLGVESGRAEHLVWLNDYLKLQTVHFDRAPALRGDPLGRWLGAIREGRES